jgi:predicted nucleic acid-binding protein
MNDDAPGSFVDTNVLVYALADTDRERSPVAKELVRRLMESGELITSTQVLNELYVTLTLKAVPRLLPVQALRYVENLAFWHVAPTDYATVQQAIGLSIASPISFWDALIVVAASRSGATRLYTEDLQHGQTLLDVQIVNPFR